MKYKHIIWDWNGTLLDDRWLCVDGINNGLLKRGLTPITEETYMNVFTFPVKNYYEENKIIFLYLQIIISNV